MAYTNKVEKDFKYTALAGLGSAALRQDEGLAELQDTEEEVFISLGDTVEETTPAVVQPDAVTPPPAPDSGAPAADRGADDTATASGSVELPWVRATMQISSPTLRLHNETVEFCRFLEPTPDETAARYAAIARVTDVVQSLFPKAEVQVFGSFVTGLYLPTSDMDLVIINSQCYDIERGLRALGKAMVEEGMARNILVIPKAKVPIVKFDDVASGVAFDVSFDIANGPKTAKYVLGLMKRLPPMRPLTIMLKLFLHQRELNEVYQGGIGSYALAVMVATFLLQHPSRMPTKYNRRPPLEANLGVLLLDFFRLFGRTLNTEAVGISCRDGGSYFRKRDRQAFLQRDRIHFLAIEDPQDEKNDLAKGSWNIASVQRAFEYAYTQLSNPVAPGDSLLARIVRLDAVLMLRSPAKQLMQVNAEESDMELDEPAAGQEAPGPARLPPPPVSSKRKREAAASERHDQHAPKLPAQPNKKRQKRNHQSPPAKAKKSKKRGKKPQIKLRDLEGSDLGSDASEEDWRHKSKKQIKRDPESDWNGKKREKKRTLSPRRERVRERDREFGDNQDRDRKQSWPRHMHFN